MNTEIFDFNNLIAGAVNLGSTDSVNRVGSIAHRTALKIFQTHSNRPQPHSGIGVPLITGTPINSKPLWLPVSQFFPCMIIFDFSKIKDTVKLYILRLISAFEQMFKKSKNVQTRKSIKTPCPCLRDVCKGSKPKNKMPMPCGTLGAD